MGTNNLIRIILCIAVIAAFFMPLESGGGSLWTMVTSMPAEIDTKTKLLFYAYLLVPFFALVILIMSVTGKASGGLLRALPFVIYVVLTAYFIHHFGQSVSDWFKSQAIGFYIIVIASLLLMFFGGSRRSAA